MSSELPAVFVKYYLLLKRLAVLVDMHFWSVHIFFLGLGWTQQVTIQFLWGSWGKGSAHGTDNLSSFATSLRGKTTLRTLNKSLDQLSRGFIY